MGLGGKSKQIQVQASQPWLGSLEGLSTSIANGCTDPRGLLIAGAACRSPLVGRRERLGVPIPVCGRHCGHRPRYESLFSRRTAATGAFGRSSKLLVARFRFCLPSRRIAEIDGVVTSCHDSRQGSIEPPASVCVQRPVRYICDRCRRSAGVAVPGRLVSRYTFCVVVNCCGHYFFASAAAGPPLNQGVRSLLISVAMTIAWLAVVKQQRVRDAVDSYSRALLEVCDSGHLRQ